jgi:hypothetical protein|tara:strand:- start:68 stop:472 length:405 start_codon:yes stop_codon:yes gene_type:complete
MSRLNDATPEDWDRLRKAHPAIEKTPKSSLEDYKPYISMAMQEAHDMLIEEGCTLDLEWEEDVVNKPSHYNTGNIECIEAIEESMSSVAFKGYLKGNCLKYLWRYDYKGKQVEDLNKATWYLNKLTLVVTEENT